MLYMTIHLPVGEITETTVVLSYGLSRGRIPNLAILV